MDREITVIGLGYVGLPLAVEFGKKFDTVGFDINSQRIRELKDGYDRTGETSKSELSESKFLQLTDSEEKIKNSRIYIITVPTPVDQSNIPDLVPVKKATELVSRVIKKGDIIIYESTVYPGCTEEFCVPILESNSNLKYNQDFFCGYSPERINPGDKKHTLTNIKKIVSGSNDETLNIIDELYSSIIEAGLYRASSIKVAEAAKVIENAQRDINIAFINELAIIFDSLKIDTSEVLEAANTKWNFLGFKPGLVGGHCIGVDPYYLTYKAQSVGYQPEVILSGRRINDNMGKFIAQKVIKLMIKKKIQIEDSEVLLLGITFKENCKDIRNSKVIDVYSELRDFNCKIDVYDPHAIKEEVFHEYGFNLIETHSLKKYDAIILTVAHDEFLSLDIDSLKKNPSVVYDVKSFLKKEDIDARL